MHWIWSNVLREQINYQQKCLINSLRKASLPCSKHCIPWHFCEEENSIKLLCYNYGRPIFTYM